MKSKAFKYVGLLFTIVAFCACKKDRLVDEGEKKLAGTWNWQYTSGGFAGGGFSPQTSGYTLKLEVFEKGKYKLYKNETKIEHGRLIKEDGLFKFVHDGVFKKDDILNSQKMLKLHGDSLDIGIAYCCDTYIALYTKN